MILREEKAADASAIHAVHAAAFARGTADGQPPPEARLVDALRACAGWIPELSIVAIDAEGAVTGHVVCTRGTVSGEPALGLGPVGVLPELQRAGIGCALMHAVLAAADAMHEPIVVLLGHPTYYPRFGFRPARELGITPPVAEWGDAFQARPLSRYRESLRGAFTYAEPFNDL
jgi:putative acetyltransferase